ncbi:MAG: PfkB family carbohydrate kinase [Desulfobacterales bacterium]
MILAIGEILFDMFPAGRRIGGAAFNFAFHIHRLKAPLRFLSRVGNDPEGRALTDFMIAQQFPIDDLQQDQKHPTGRVHVALDAQGSPRFEILPDVAYDFISATPSIERFVARDCRLIYFGSLIQRTSQGAQTVRRILGHRGPRAKCFFDINLRPDCFDAAILDYSLQESDILKLNEAELSVLADINGIRGGADDAVASLQARFGIETVALTRGENGSCLYQADTRHEAKPPGHMPVKDTVGAGDAFAAMLALGYLEAWPPERLLASANRLAAMVCGIEGAVPNAADFYERLGQ